MNRCTSSEIGKYLHAFELNQLSDDQRMAFEEHLLTCDSCFEEVTQFEMVSNLLSSDPDIKQLTQASAKAFKTESFLNRIKTILWPKTQPLILRPVVSYIVLALMVYPTYIGLQKISEPEMRPTQTLVMTDTRGINTTSIFATKPLSLVFRVSTASSDDTLIVQLKDETGEIIFNNSQFTSLTESGLGTISFEENTLTDGQYFLTISTQNDAILAEYTFLVK